jgi:mannose-1-phosphate guanylyltransferase
VKGFLLAAGVGTRLRPLTDAIPKCLVPIQGTPLLGIWLEWCAIYGIDEILLNSHAHSERVREFVGAYHGPVRVTLTHEPELLGSAGTLHVNRDFVAGEKEFAVLYADVLTNCRFDRLLDFHRMRHSPVTLGTYRVPNPTLCGIIVTDESERVVEFVENWSARCLRFPSTNMSLTSAPWKSTSRHSGSGPDMPEHHEFTTGSPMPATFALSSRPNAGLCVVRV